ncbi:Signaling mucin MSB2 like protein [Verticillium longisporum]|nr:Signaling mucin MSB2 like protein [Verticillium longisporum]
MAENEKPRIYFPRHIKRQFTNSTLSQPGTFPPAPETPPFTSRTDTPTFITSLRQSLTNDLIDPAESSTSSSESLSEPSGTSQRTTVVISSTIRVPPTTVPEVLDSIQVSSEELSASESTAPQPSPSSSNPETSTSQTTTEPDGTTAAGTTTTEAVTTTTAVETTTAATETTTQETSTEAPTTTAITTASSEPVTTTEASTTAVTSPEQSSVVESVSSGGESGTGLLPTIIVFPTSSSTTAEAEPTSSTATTEAQTSAQPTVSETVTTSSGIVIAPTGLVTTSSSEPATSAEEQVIPTVTDSVASPTDSTAQTTPATTTSSESQSNSIQSVISAVTSILSVPTNATESEIEPTQTATTNLSGSTVAEETSVAVSATTTASVPITTDVSEPPVSANTTIQDQSTQPPVSLTSLPPGESSFVSSTSIFPGSSVISSVSPSASGEASVAPNSTESVPTASASIPITEPSSSVNVTSILGPSIEPTAAPSSVPTGLPSSSVLPDNTTVVFDEPSTAPIAPSVSASGEPSTIVPVTSLAPTKTITGTEIWLPSTIIVENSTPTRAPTDAVAPTSAVALPSDLPKVIGPGDTENVAQPEGTVLLQVGFLYAENYEFVSKNPMAAAQLFTLLPIALTDGAGIDAGKVIVTSLVPYDTMPSLGYITTLARFWYPKSMVDQLRMDIKIPNSRLYNNPQQLIYNLTQNINPAIDIIPGSENIPGGNGGAPKSGSPNGNNDMFNKKESNSTPIQTGTAAAIGIGAVTVGVAYGAAMFLIARRYKRKKQAHRRASSISGTSSDMRYTGTGSPAMMGGALMSRDFSNYGGVAGGRDSHGSGQTGNSGRTAKISAPVAAENSLGWN